MALKKQPANLPTMTVRPNGPMAGHEFLMYEPPSELIFSGERLMEREVAAAAMTAVIDHTLDVDLGRIPPQWAVALGDAWLQQWREVALPPTNGRRSPKRSPSQP